jgi:hypothetical protein
MTFERGLALFSLGHFAATYENWHSLRLCSKYGALAGENESQWASDVFLSYSSRSQDQAREIKARGDTMGVRIFMDERELGFIGYAYAPRLSSGDRRSFFRSDSITSIRRSRELNRRN